MINEIMADQLIYCINDHTIISGGDAHKIKVGDVCKVMRIADDTGLGVSIELKYLRNGMCAGIGNAGGFFVNNYGFTNPSWSEPPTPPTHKVNTSAEWS